MRLHGRCRRYRRLRLIRPRNGSTHLWLEGGCWLIAGRSLRGGYVSLLPQHVLHQGHKLIPFGEQHPDDDLVNLVEVLFELLVGHVADGGAIARATAPATLAFAPEGDVLGQRLLERLTPRRLNLPVRFIDGGIDG